MVNLEKGDVKRLLESIAPKNEPTIDLRALVQFVDALQGALNALKEVLDEKGMGDIIAWRDEQTGTLYPSEISVRKYLPEGQSVAPVRSPLQTTRFPELTPVGWQRKNVFAGAWENCESEEAQTLSKRSENHVYRQVFVIDSASDTDSEKDAHRPICASASNQRTQDAESATTEQRALFCQWVKEAGFEDSMITLGYKLGTEQQIHSLIKRAMEHGQQSKTNVGQLLGLLEQAEHQLRTVGCDITADQIRLQLSSRGVL